MQKKEEELLRRMEKLGIKEGDITEKFILGSGKGGQKVNKTSSCVYLKHLPSGVEVKCMKSRFQALNRLFARRELCDRLEEILFQKKSAKKQAAEKIRRQKRRRSRKAKEKILVAKKHRSKIKKLRQGNPP